MGNGKSVGEIENCRKPIKKRYMKTRNEREAEFKAKIAELDAYIEKMNGKSNKTDEEIKDLIKAMQQVNKYLRAIGAPESAMYDL
jgi:peptidoglycan hydrolase CwlO-like protein